MLRRPASWLLSKNLKARKAWIQVLREREHIALQRENPDGSVTPLTLPNHRVIKSGTLRFVCRQGMISRDDFLQAFEAS